MAGVTVLQDLRDHRAMRRAVRLVAQGHLQGGRAGASARQIAQQVGLSDLNLSVNAAREALAAAGQAGDMLGLAESHRILGMLAAGRSDWHLATVHARLCLECGTVHEAEGHLLLAVSAARAGGGCCIERQLEATVRTSTETGAYRYKQTALLELAGCVLRRGRPRAASAWLEMLGQMAADNAWQARHLALLHWAGRQRGAADVTRLAADNLAGVALRSADPGTHALVHWVLAEESWEAGFRVDAVYQAQLGRQRVTEALLAHRMPDFAEILPDIACCGLLSTVDGRLAELLSRVETVRDQSGTAPTR